MKMYHPNSTMPLASSSSVGSENSKNKQQFGSRSADVRKAFSSTKKAVANGIIKGHLNLNGSGRKRSVEPRPHPAKLLNKRYWDDVRAGRVCPPATTTTAEDEICVEFCSKNVAKHGEKRKALLHLDLAKQNAKSQRNQSLTMQHCHQPTPGTFSPPNQSAFAPQSAGGTVQFGATIPPQNASSLLQFAPFLSPPRDILRRPPAAVGGSLFMPPTEGFVQSPFPQTALGSSPTPPMNMNLIMPPPSPLMLLQQQQFTSSSGVASATNAAAWTLLQMLAEGAANGRQQRQQTRHEPQQQQTVGTLTGHNSATERAKKDCNIFAAHCSFGCVEDSPSKVPTNSKSDAQIDELMDQMAAQKFKVKAKIAEQSQTQHSQSHNGECRLCFVPIPMPVPIPFPVTTDFILRHFGTM